MWTAGIAQPKTGQAYTNGSRSYTNVQYLKLKLLSPQEERGPDLPQPPSPEVGAIFLR